MITCVTLDASNNSLQTDIDDYIFFSVRFSLFVYFVLICLEYWSFQTRDQEIISGASKDGPSTSNSFYFSSKQ